MTSKGFFQLEWCGLCNNQEDTICICEVIFECSACTSNAYICMYLKIVL